MRKPAGMYELFLHWKQGDDFDTHIKASKTVSEALRAWAEDHLARAAVCQEIALALDGCAVSVDADTHLIAMVGKNDHADEVLAALAERGLISKSPLGGEDEDLDDDVAADEETDGGGDAIVDEAGEEKV